MKFWLKPYIASVLFGLVCMPALATDRVLVMTISEYRDRPLAGVRHDANNAIKLADALGYATANATVLKDTQLSAAGMRGAFQNLAAQVRQGDRLFVYYSGHGASQQVGGECVQALVAQDGTLIETSELIRLLDPIKSKTSDAIVIFDACHAGGNRDIAVSRSAAPAKARAEMASVTAKVWTPKEGEQCQRPVNQLSKSWSSPGDRVSRGVGNGEYNFAFIAAANEREIALDDASKGGLATVGLLSCATSGVADSDGSQSVSVSELRACAQQYVAKAVPEVNAKAGTNYTPHSLEVWGNKEKTLPLSALRTAGGPKDPAGQVLANFKSQVANSNGNWSFIVEPSSTPVPIGQEFFLKYKTQEPAYIYMLYVGTGAKDGKEMDMGQLWPRLGEHRQIPAGEGKLPTLVMEPPAGDNTFMVVASQTPMDFSAVFGQGGSVGVGAQSLKAMECAMQTMRNVSLKADTACGSTRNARISDASLGNVGGYVARMVTVKGR